MYSLEVEAKEVAQAVAVSGLDGQAGDKVVIRPADIGSARWFLSWFNGGPAKQQVTFLRDGQVVAALWLKPHREDASQNLFGLQIEEPP